MKDVLHMVTKGLNVEDNLLDALEKADAVLILNRNNDGTVDSQAYVISRSGHEKEMAEIVQALIGVVDLRNLAGQGPK